MYLCLYSWVVIYVGKKYARKKNDFFSKLDLEFSEKFKRIKDQAGFDNEYDPEKAKSVKRTIYKLGKVIWEQKFYAGENLSTDKDKKRKKIIKLGTAEWKRLKRQRDRKISKIIEKLY